MKEKGQKSLGSTKSFPFGGTKSFPFGDTKRFHMVGIGGSGMCGLAEVLQASGLQVTGTDLQDSQVCARLRALGISLEIGHHPGLVAGAQILVRSLAVGVWVTGP